MKLFPSAALFVVLGSCLVAGGCASSGPKSSASAAQESDEEDDSNRASPSRQGSVRAKEADGAAEKVAPAPQQKAAPSPQSTVEFVTTTFSNEETFAGQLPQAKVEDVLRELEQAYRERNDDGGALISYLVFRRLSGSSRDFLSVLEKRGSTASSRDPWILIECSYAALLRNDYGIAQYLLDQAELVGKGRGQVKSAVLHARGMMFYQQKKTVLAMANFRAAAKQGYEPAMLTLALFAIKVGDHVGAFAQLNKLKDSAANNLNVKAALGVAFRQANKPEEAAEFLNAVVRARPTDRRALWNLALAKADVPSKRKEAISLLERYVTAPGSLMTIDGKAQDLLVALQAKEEEAKAQLNKAKPGAEESKAGAPTGQN